MSTRIYNAKSYTVERSTDVEWAEGWKAAVWPIVATSPKQALDVAIRELASGRVGWTEVVVCSVEEQARDQSSDPRKFLATVRYRVQKGLS